MLEHRLEQCYRVALFILHLLHLFITDYHLAVLLLGRGYCDEDAFLEEDVRVRFPRPAGNLQRRIYANGALFVRERNILCNVGRISFRGSRKAFDVRSDLVDSCLDIFEAFDNVGPDNAGRFVEEIQRQKPCKYYHGRSGQF
ncbi:hypothetical protein ES703_119278 [subsurface metagenome]